MIRNPKGQESDQSTFHKGSQGVELQIMVATLGSGKIGWEDWSLQPKDFMSRALTTWQGCCCHGTHV